MRHLNHLFHFTIMQGGLEHGIKDIVMKFETEMMYTTNAHSRRIVDVKMFLILLIQNFFRPNSCLFLELTVISIAAVWLPSPSQAIPFLTKICTDIYNGYSELNKPPMCYMPNSQFFSLMFFVLPLPTEHSTYAILSSFF